MVVDCTAAAPTVSVASRFAPAPTSASIILAVVACRLSQPVALKALCTFKELKHARFQRARGQADVDLHTVLPPALDRISREDGVVERRVTGSVAAL